jgi:RNA polymerase sigma-70 factor, ECF subfamily
LGFVFLELFRQSIACDPALDGGGVERTLERLITAARSVWPGVRLSPEVFVPYLARRLPEPTVQAIENMHVTDLWLACGCARGDSNAIAAFTKSYLAPIFPLPGQLAQLSADVEQITALRLLVAEKGRMPKIADYAGRGDLGSWSSVVALRVALMVLRKRKREILLDDAEGALSDLADAGDAEVVHLKQRYRAEFAESFQRALRTLSPRARNVLRQHHVDRLTMEQIARVYRVHRITVVRWIEGARTKLARETRKNFTARLGLQHSELESVMRMIRSQIDLSLRTYLRSD